MKPEPETLILQLLVEGEGNHELAFVGRHHFITSSPHHLT
jgi:hypothetical protein